jgi:hypothetical protein
MNFMHKIIIHGHLQNITYKAYLFKAYFYKKIL